MKFRCVSYVIIAFVSFLVSLPLSKHYGAIGCAASTAGGLILGQIIIMNIYYEKRIGLDILGFWKEILKMSIAPILISLLSYQGLSFVNIDTYFDLLVWIVLFSIVYLSVFWFASMNSYEKELFGAMIRKLLRIKRNVRNK